ncbi:MAG: class I tRNA ligase family protein, partial [Myxococcota bacterium]|nr:class I tRNA ligase family protein [Myxococcota bacterium]
YEVLCDFEGRALVGELGVGKGLAAQHAFIDRDSVLLPADYVTLDQGTGCVHTAPGHGQEDFQLGQHFGLDVVSPVNQYGKFVDAPGTEGFVGVQVHKANPMIAQMLHEKGRLLNQPGDKVRIERYPHGWRSKKPVIFRATTQWFIAMEPESAGQDASYKLRERALEVIDGVEWLPSWGRDRIFNMVSGRPDWCISRQRSWGVPITALHCNDCQHVLATKALADHVADLVEEQGVDVWFSLEPTELAPAGATCPGCGGTDWSKEEDILDVWFDSGVSWSAVLETQLGLGDRADLYLEGSDQHRGWFQSSLMCGLLSRDQSPYKACLTHGFVVDEEGRKYSKSSKNFEPPKAMLDNYGAEILRLWVAAVDYRAEITLSETILKRIADSYRKIRNTSRFLLGSLDDFDPNTDMVPLEELEEIDRWVLARAADTVARIDKAFEEYQFHTVYHTLVQFATVDLSNVYMDVTKDRMYCEGADSKLRRSGQTAYWLVLDALVRAFSPILSFTVQEL